MGSKGVKAIAVRGTKDINLARPDEFLKLCNEVLEYIKFRNERPVPNVMTILQGLGSPQEMKHTDEKWHTENFMWGNARTRRKDFWNEEIEKKWEKTQLSARKRLISCYNCPMKCGAIISLPGYADLHDEMFLKTHLYDGSLCRRPGFCVSGSLNVQPSMESTGSQHLRLWPLPLNLKKPVF